MKNIYLNTMKATAKALLMVGILAAPSLAIAQQPEIDCASLPEDKQQLFYDLSGRAVEAASENKLQDALEISLKAMAICTSDSYTEYNLARIYHQLNNCPLAYYHYERLSARSAQIKAESKEMEKALTRHFREIQKTCGNVVSLEIHCSTEDTEIAITGFIDKPTSCPLYTKIVPGTYQLTASKNDFYTYRDSINVPDVGAVYTVPELQDANDFGVLRVRCPRGATKFALVSEDGITNEYACPWEGKIPTGTYKLRLGNADDPRESTITIAKQTTIEHIFPTNKARANCSLTTVNSHTSPLPVLAIILAALASMGILRRRRKEQSN